MKSRNHKEIEIKIKIIWPIKVSTPNPLKEVGLNFDLCH
jgi:hypothetical protein